MNEKVTSQSSCSGRFAPAAPMKSTDPIANPRNVAEFVFPVALWISSSHALFVPGIAPLVM